ncbi:MAG TPA: extracellular matrix/biofilm biosynthesis regulator RemA family protein [bacterium]
MSSGALLNIGFDNAVAVAHIVAVVSADPSPIRRLREAAGRQHKLIDATNGRRTRTVIITDSDHVILSSLQPETVAQRLQDLRHG